MVWICTIFMHSRIKFHKYSTKEELLGVQGWNSCAYRVRNGLKCVSAPRHCIMFFSQQNHVIKGEFHWNLIFASADCPSLCMSLHDTGLLLFPYLIILLFWSVVLCPVGYSRHVTVSRNSLWAFQHRLHYRLPTPSAGIKNAGGRGATSKGNLPSSRHMEIVPEPDQRDPGF